MSDKRYQGNIISKTPVAPADGFKDTPAPGVWSLDEALSYTKAGLWPSLSNGVAPYAYIAGYSSANRERVSISTAGNATNFGTFADDAVTYNGGTSSNTRGIVGGSGRTSNDYQYWTLASTGVSQVFGDAVQSGDSRMTGNHTRAINIAAVTDDNTIEYLTIASTGNGTDFGDTILSRGYLATASSATRSLFMGGWPNNGVTNTVDYITIASTGNATDFGDLAQNHAFFGGCADGTRAVTSAGLQNTSPTTYINNMDYATIASTGNFADFGDATQSSRSWRGAAGATRGLFMGSDAGDSGYENNRIDSITIQTTGNATDYGDLVKTNGTRFGAMSNATVAVQPS